MNNLKEQKCPKCDFRAMKSWVDLSEEEKLLVEKLPLNAEFTYEKRKNHFFCLRCWFETDFGNEETII